MFLLLGAFFHVKSPALREDINVNSKYIFFSISLPNLILETATKEEIYAAYDTSAYNCYITGKFSFKSMSERGGSDIQRPSNSMTNF